ncbi:helicase HerA-like domain-containing protein [uncultured Sphingomonas sp.]|uniref:helicase HerA-like domain-containing protein n=1 Tax=uncultured Sphingomonas sp. TaxID=158754 RepID=UPI0025ED6FFF|nr:helicase HerA-like domain-containing protein [uncultured Sphingomonas sp.]
MFIGAAPGVVGGQYLELSRANRHGLIAGATGTGKTVTLQGLVEGLSAAGVPTFVADVKGDLAGLGMPGSPTANAHAVFAARAAELNYEGWRYEACPVQLWDLFGEQGHPIRTTVSEMGPLLLARLLGLNEVQEGVLNIAFHVADKDGLLLIDLDDLQAMLVSVGERAEELTLTYGNVSKPSVGAIQRALLQLRGQGGDHFFGEPALDLPDFLNHDESGRGVVNILAADRLMASPRLYSTFLLWLLSELWELLPEAGDLAVPKLCFFFDEAHLLFDDAPPALLEKVEQVVRLIRSKGVGVYFITQNPTDIPDKVAGQLGNRIQHALRAFTPRDQAAVRSAAETFRPNPQVDVASAITELKVGEALVSLLQPDGSPSPVQRTSIKPPSSRVGPLAPHERKLLVETDAIGTKYAAAADRHSAEEMLAATAQEAAASASAARARTDAEKQDALRAKEEARLARERAQAEAAARRAEDRERREAEREEGRRAREAAKPTMADKMLQSAGRSIASSVGRQIGNSLLRGLLGGLVRRR